MPAFSMTVRKPEPGNVYTVELIRAIAAEYTPALADDEELRKSVQRFKDGINALRDGETAPREEKTAAEESSGRKRRRSKGDRPVRPRDKDPANEEANPSSPPDAHTKYSGSCRGCPSSTGWKWPPCQAGPGRRSTRPSTSWRIRGSHLPSLQDAKPAGKVLARDHRVVGDKVQRPLLRPADAEGRRSPCHPLGTRYRSPFSLR